MCKLLAKTLALGNSRNEQHVFCFAKHGKAGDIHTT